MGIKDLNKFITALNVSNKAPLSCLKGRAVAIDASNWIYVNWTMAAKRVIFATNLLASDPDTDAIRKQWFAIAWKSIERFISNGVYPIFVFDGPAPEEKGPEKLKRAAEKNTYVTKYTETITAARQQTDILDAGNIDMKALRQLCYNAYKIDWGEFDLIMNLLQALGFQTFKPNCEAEKFCSMMCLEGLVVAVFSSDTDNIAYGCPCLITDVSTEATMEGPMDVMTYVQYNDVINASQFTREQFLDFCIMHGCDYNSRIPKVGPVNINKLIRTYSCIEALASFYDISCLKHEVCRSIFSYTSTKELNHGQDVVISFITPSSTDPEVLDYYVSMFEAHTYMTSLRNHQQYVLQCATSI